jgi:hypothetical protein
MQVNDVDGWAGHENEGYAGRLRIMYSQGHCGVIYCTYDLPPIDDMIFCFESCV